MIYNINGAHYYNLIDYGVRNLAIYKDKVNALNVFPVPDGDTGTNMLLTLENGFSAIRDSSLPLNEMARTFARAVVFGARGNSGVIVSQFFKGMAESFYETENADFCEFASALEKGVEAAYKAVTNPVEGTILTVVREAIEYVRSRLEDYKIDSIDDVINAFLNKAKTSLKDTPKYLEVLRTANVVDSGGAGIIYVFEGMKKYLEGKELPAIEYGQKPSDEYRDYSMFDEDSVFEYGYCTELLIQLTSNRKAFVLEEFRNNLNELGDSVVISYEIDKVKLHIHTAAPEEILKYCHNYGEFLSLKIENMSVQHREIYTDTILVSNESNDKLTVVAVAHNPTMEKSFFEMGADIVLSGDHSYVPTALDFVRAFEKAASKRILVFPNNKNTNLTAQQAKSLITDAEVYIIDTKSDTECYSLLPFIDYDNEDVTEIANDLIDALSNINTVSITSAVKDTVYNGKDIKIGDYVAIKEDNSIVSAGENLAAVVGSALKSSVSAKECDVITVFANKPVQQNIKDSIVAFIEKNSPRSEIQMVETNDSFYDIVFSLE